MPKSKGKKEIVAEKRFCSHCGSPMTTIKRGAEENIISQVVFHHMFHFRAASPFDDKTGLRNYCWYYKCPMYEKKEWYEIFSAHEEYFTNKVFN